MQERRAGYEQSLEQIIGQIQEGKERQMGVNEQKEAVKRSNAIKEKKVKEREKDIKDLQEH